MTCTASGTATAGQYENFGEVIGTPTLGDPVQNNDPSHYVGVIPSIDFEKATNGVDADTAPGPQILVGDAVTWSYEVSNTSNVTLTNIAVVDDRGVTVGCPGTTLAAAASMTCTAGGTALAGQYSNLGTVTASPPSGPAVNDSDPSHYFGVDASIDIEKATNGEDADSPTGPLIAVGDTATWTYLVSNTGNVDLTNVNVGDSEAGVTPVRQADQVGNNDNILDVGEIWVYEASAAAVAGQYMNTGSVTADDPAALHHRPTGSLETTRRDPVSSGKAGGASDRRGSAR